MGTLWFLLLCVLWQFAKTQDIFQPISMPNLTEPKIDKINTGLIIGNQNFVNIPNVESVFGKPANGNSIPPTNPSPAPPNPISPITGPPTKVSPIRPGPRPPNIDSPGSIRPIKIPSLPRPPIIAPVPPIKIPPPIISPVPPKPKPSPPGSSSEVYPRPRPPVKIPSGVDYISPNNPNRRLPNLNSSNVPLNPITPRPVISPIPSQLLPDLVDFQPPPQINVPELFPTISFPKNYEPPQIDLPSLIQNIDLHSDYVPPGYEPPSDGWPPKSDDDYGDSELAK